MDVIPFFQSKIKMYEINLYNILPDDFGKFDIILFSGVLYHLRFPFYGIKLLVDCLEDNGVLFVETAINTSRLIRNKEYVFVGTLLSHFNKTALITTLASFHCKLIKHGVLKESFKNRFRENIARLLHSFIPIQRQWFIFQKDIKSVDKDSEDYWYQIHKRHDKPV